MSWQLRVQMSVSFEGETRALLLSFNDTGRATELGRGGQSIRSPPPAQNGKCDSGPPRWCCALHSGEGRSQIRGVAFDSGLSGVSGGGISRVDQSEVSESLPGGPKGVRPEFLP